MRKLTVICIINLLFLAGAFKAAFALEHTQKDGLFKMDVPEQLYWREFPQEIIITYPDGQTVAMDIQLIPSVSLSEEDAKKKLKDSNEAMIKQGIQAHHGALIDNKEIKVDGVYATQLDFKTSPPDPIDVTYIAFFNKGYAFSITYGTNDEKMRLLLDDAVATIKFK